MILGPSWGDCDDAFAPDGVFGVVSRGGAEVVRPVLMQPPPLRNLLQSIARCPTGQLLHRQTVSLVILPANFRQIHAVHLGVSFQNTNEVTRLDGGVLPGIADEHDSGVVALGEPQDLCPLRIRSQACLIHHDDRAPEPVAIPERHVCEEIAHCRR